MIISTVYYSGTVNPFVAMETDITQSTTLDNVTAGGGMLQWLQSCCLCDDRQLMAFVTSHSLSHDSALMPLSPE